jgi:hypothetical protein
MGSVLSDSHEWGQSSRINIVNGVSEWGQSFRIHMLEQPASGPLAQLAPEDRRSAPPGIPLGKWGQCANLDRIHLFPILPSCHGACVSNFPVPLATSWRGLRRLFPLRHRWRTRYEAPHLQDRDLRRPGAVAPDYDIHLCSVSHHCPSHGSDVLQSDHPCHHLPLGPGFRRKPGHSRPPKWVSPRGLTL